MVRVWLKGCTDLVAIVINYWKRSLAFTARSAQSHTISGEMTSLVSAGKYLPYFDIPVGSYIDLVYEPVNQVPTFQMWREHLTLIAYELQHQHFERAAVRSHDIRGHASRPSIITTEDGIRNANISQWGREELGRLWRELHEWAWLDPTSTTNDWDGVPKQELKAKIEAFCAACEGRGRIGLIHDEHNHTVWQEALRRGRRFLPDFNQTPFGIFELGGDGTMNGATSLC